MTAATPVATNASPGIFRRARTHVVARCTTWACWWGGITGVAPHVLHHAGPLAGTALVAGTGGTLLFGGLGFVATAPLLWRLRRRTGTWRAPVLALAVFAAFFALSTLVIGPALTSNGDVKPPPHPQPTEVGPHDHS